MHRPRTMTRALAGVCVLTLLLTACGDDDDGADTTDTEETTASTAAADESTASEPEETTTTSEAEGDDGDEGDPEAVATAEAINLRLEDLAEGWSEEEDADDDESDDLDQCFATVDIEASTVGEAETPTFSAETPDGQGGQVISMQTVVFDSPDTATTVLSEVSSAEFATCAQQLLTQSEEGTEAVLTPTVDDPPLGEESVGIAGAVQIPAAEGGAAQDARIDLHAIRTAEVVSFTVTLDIGATPSTAFEQTLAELYTLIADRQAAEVG